MPRWVCVVAALATASAHVIYHQYYSGDAAAAHRSSAGAEQLSPTRAHGGRERTSSVDDADSVGDAVHAAAANATRADARVDLRKADGAPRRSIWSWILLLRNAAATAIIIVEAWLCCYLIFEAVIYPDEVRPWHCDLPRLIVRERFVLIPLGASSFVVYLCARLLYGVDMTQPVYAALPSLAAAAIGAMKDVCLSFLIVYMVAGVLVVTTHCEWPGIWSTPRFDDGERVEVLYVGAWYPATVRGYDWGLYLVEGVEGARLWLSPSQLRAPADDNHSITPGGLGAPATVPTQTPSPPGPDDDVVDDNSSTRGGGVASTPASASEGPLLTVAGAEPGEREVFRVGDRVQAVFDGGWIITHVVDVSDSHISVDDGAGGERERPYAFVRQHYSTGDRINVWFDGAWHRAIVGDVRRRDGAVLPHFTDGRSRPRTWRPLRFIRRQRYDDVVADTTGDDDSFRPEGQPDDGMAPARRSPPSDDEEDPLAPSNNEQGPLMQPRGDDDSFQPEELQSDDDGEVPARRMAPARRSTRLDDEENEQRPFASPSDDDEGPAPPPTPNTGRSSDYFARKAAPASSNTPRRSPRLNRSGRWRNDARELLELLEDGSVRLGSANVGRATLQRYGFFVYASKRLYLRPPKHYPSYYLLVGKDSCEASFNQLKTESNKRLVAYLEKALALPDGFKTEEEVRVSLGLSMDGALPKPKKSEEAYKLPGGKRSILISPEGDPEPTAQELSWEGKVFEKDGIYWSVRKVEVVAFPDGEARTACWCYAFDLYGNDPPDLQDHHWCVPCNELQDVEWVSRPPQRPRRSKRKAAGRLQSELVKRNRRGKKGGHMRKFGARQANGELSQVGRRLVSEGTAPSQVGNPPGSKPRKCPATGRSVYKCPCQNYPNDPSHGSQIANVLLMSVMSSPSMRGTRNDPAGGVTNKWSTYFGIASDDICPDYTPQEIALILRASMPKPHGRSTLDDVFKRRQADDRHKFSYDHIKPRSVIIADYGRLRLRPGFDADGRPNVVIRDLCHPYNIQHADKYANCNIKGAAPLSKEHEVWYRARLLCFWDEEELKKPFADRTARPFETTIAMLKEETRKGHCFLGFEPEIHHEFNY